MPKINEKEKVKVKPIDRNTALLNWISCEVGVHNLDYHPAECYRLYNIYKKICREDSKNDK